jgi:predicted nucleic acid-binding protein
VLVDTSVWIDHLRRGNEALSRHLSAGDVWCHPFVIGELACGSLRRRREILSLLAALPQTPMPEHHEVLAFVEARGLIGRGIGWVDAHLLAAATLARLPFWSADRRLDAVARHLGVSARL